MAEQSYAQFAKTISGITGKTYTTNDVSNAAKKISGGGSSVSAPKTTPAVNPNGLLSNGKSADLSTVAAAINKMGIATPNYSPSTGLNQAGQDIYKSITNTDLYATKPVVPEPAVSPYTTDYTMPPVTPITPVETKPTDTKTAYDTLIKEIKGNTSDLYSEKLKAEEAAGIQQKQEAKNNIQLKINTIVANAQVAQQTLESQAGTGKDVTGQFLDRNQQEIQRQTAIKTLPLEAQLAAASSDLEYAQDRLNTLFDLKVKDAEINRENYIKAAEVALQYADKKEAQAIEEAKWNREVAYNTTKDKVNYLRDLTSQALKDGNSNLMSALSRVDENSKTFDEDIANAIKRNPGVESVDAPKVVSINGVDMQWNPSTGTWDNISASGAASAEQVGKSNEQISFLRDTISSATKLVNAAGPNLMTQGLGNFFVGNTKVKQLAQQLDTLKVNLLTLNTDPAVKKFFGPQMTERDTQLMTSAGTTMDAYTNTPEQLKAELTRYDDLLNKIQTAVKTGQTGSNLITAPDGNIIQIVD